MSLVDLTFYLNNGIRKYFLFSGPLCVMFELAVTRYDGRVLRTTWTPATFASLRPRKVLATLGPRRRKNTWCRRCFYVVDREGLEPSTSAMRMQRSTNWAISPWNMTDSPTSKLEMLWMANKVLLYSLKTKWPTDFVSRETIFQHLFTYSIITKNHGGNIYMEPISK